MEASPKPSPHSGKGMLRSPVAMLGASAWLRKNVCADDGGTSIAPLVGS